MLPLLSSIILVVVLALVVQDVDGDQKIVHVSEPFSDDGDIVTNSGNVNASSPLCCTYGNCTCQSFDDALENLTSNVLLNITTDVMLSLPINTSNLENVSIIGHNNPTVNCKGIGRMHFTFCNNCIIQGITLDGCGTGNIDNHTVPGLKLSYSSNLTIQNCSFQHSIGQAVVLSDILGDVNINHCKFVNNNHYRGHGAAISYSSNNIIKYPPHSFKIYNCNFSHNEGAESLVYIKNGMPELNNNITLCDSIFYNNQGVSIYIINQKVYFKGKVSFQNNTAYRGAGIYIGDNSIVIFDRNSDVKFIHNSARNYGGAIYSNGNLLFKDNSNTVFSNNNAFEGGAVYSDYLGTVYFEDKSTTVFSNNIVSSWGGAIGSNHGSTISFKDISTTVFSNNNAHGGGAILSDIGSTISFEDKSITEFTTNKATYGGAIAIDDNSAISFEGHSTTKFTSNNATKGGAIFSDDGSTISFEDNSTTEFTSNKANYGGAIFSDDSSTISFEDNSTKTFTSNKATYGGAIYSNGNLLFKDNSSTVFSNNNAFEGGAVYSDYLGTVSFKDKSTTVFSNNIVSGWGGAIGSNHGSTISFEDISTTVFSNNNAHGGAAILSDIGSIISFEDKSITEFTTNKATYGGAIAIDDNSAISFEDHSTTNFTSNNATKGGAIFSDDGSTISFEDNSTTEFTSNKANYGGAIFSDDSSTISFEDSSTKKFTSSKATYGGAIYSNGNLLFKDNSSTVFSNNNAFEGGAVYSDYLGTVSFEDKSTTVFSNNIVSNWGGAIGSNHGSTISFKDNSTTVFTSNNATSGGAILSYDSSTISFEDNSATVFTSNKANYGGAIASWDGGTISFEHNPTTLFSKNNAKFDGKSMFVENSYTLFVNHGFVTFYNNEAKTYGGAGYFNMQSNMVLGRNAKVSFENNKAQYGGALCINNNANITFKENSTASFKNNMATADGGAINILTNSDITVKDYTKITFADNNAQYGGAMFFDTTFSTLVFNNHEGRIGFINNIATIAGKSVYIDLSRSCNKSCLNTRRIIGIKNASKQFIATPPNKLEFYNPSIYIDDEKTECDTYYVNHVMLGQEINIPACVLDYYDQPADAAQFLLYNTGYQNYTFSGSTQILLSCDIPLQGISVIGNKSLSESLNYSINIVLHDVRSSNWKQIFVKLTFEFTSCYPGFWQYPSSQKCECYNATDIVFCSGSSSTIKGGYWFGTVNGKPTVTLCPVNYCNFACCETSNGYYHLSPVRDNQCRSHRSGTACGSCTHGYTLSFDSTECISVESCTAGQRVLVILLTVIYWIVIVTLVFAMMYYKVGIGYLYSITYYYSIVDILLSQNLHTSRGRYLTVSIMSSFSKITPQFLGEFCLFTGMSGIDQQIIHYIHPLAVIVILGMISLLARRSRRFTTIIGHGIIHVI